MYKIRNCNIWVFSNKGVLACLRPPTFFALNVYYSGANKKPLEINWLKGTQRDFKARSVPYIKLF